MHTQALGRRRTEELDFVTQMCSTTPRSSPTLQIPLHPGAEPGPPIPVCQVSVLHQLPLPISCGAGICLLIPVAFYDVIQTKMAKGKHINPALSTNSDSHFWCLRLESWGWFCLEEPEGDLINAYKYLRGGGQKDGARLFSEVPSDRTRCTRRKFEHRQFHLNRRRHFLTSRVAEP